MVNPTIKILENIITTHISTVYEEVPPTEEEFLKIAEADRRALDPNGTITNDEFNCILSRLRELLVVRLDLGTYINDKGNGHKSWLPSKRADIEFGFWDRYKKYLEFEKHWNTRVTANLGKISDEILDLCGDPSEDTFDIKGLVLGDVQSGKTANYTAICNKAADVGYRIIIVLAGIQENLRIQTQERLDLEFAGRKSQFYINSSKQSELGEGKIFVGVGNYNKNKEVAAFTSVTGDFNSRILSNSNLGIKNVNCPILLVVKKNKKILNNLITWLSDNNIREQDGKINLPLMLIDDEADNASINTREEENRTAINDCIRRLLGLFNKTTYLGVTATPFANIFIDPDNDDDLFPADFIYSLSAPTSYIGADKIFGENADSEKMLEMINESELLDCIPLKHKKDFKVESLPADLYEAANYFLLFNAIRDYRGDMTAHRTMMVHVSLYTTVQEQIEDILTEWLTQVKSDVRHYHLRNDRERHPTIKALHKVWNKYNLTAISGIEWEDLIRDYLHKAISPIVVKAVNSKAKGTPLNYFEHKHDGLRVIAVGGYILSRGLTLEGLGVTYFHRNTRMYDTLMQMGRWFGYRPNYGDIAKVWMTPEAIDWYGQITRATAELKDDIALMRHVGQTPREFGLKVRQDPGALIVTARNKMRNAEDLDCNISIAGNLLETPRLKASEKILLENEKVFKEFIDRLASIGVKLEDDPDNISRGHYYWRNVPREYIASLLRRFQTNPWHLNFNGMAIAEYVEDTNWDDGWDVVLISKGKGEAYDGLRYGNQKLIIKGTQSRKILVDKKMLSVSGTKVRVGSGGCTRIGLTKAEILKAEEDYRAIPGNEKKVNVPDKAYLTSTRRPILMLHIINAEYSGETNKNMPPFLFALGVGVPKTNGSEKLVRYKVNQVEWRNWVDTEDINGTDEDME